MQWRICRTHKLLIRSDIPKPEREELVELLLTRCSRSKASTKSPSADWVSITQ